MKKIISKITICGCMIAALFGLASCNDDLDVQQSYEFTVETMPVPKELAKGETAEIRCELKRSGEFADALYTIRYFQYDGEGSLSLDNNLTLLPNDRYLLENEKFRLYYTSQCDESQNFIVVVEDNFSTFCELEFDFNHDNGDESEDVDSGNNLPVIHKPSDSLVVVKPWR